MKPTKKQTMPPKKAPIKFESIAISELPDRVHNVDTSDLDAALAAALADPERAVVFFKGEPGKCASRRNRIAHYLEKIKRTTEFNLSVRNGVVYLWKA